MTTCYYRLLLVEPFFSAIWTDRGCNRCPFLYCNQIELFDIVLPAIFWLGVFASRLNLVWVRFAFIFPNELICNFMLNPLHQFDLCGTANIICIWYPWLLSYCHPLKIKAFFLGFMSEVITFWSMETIFTTQNYTRNCKCYHHQYFDSANCR